MSVAVTKAEALQRLAPNLRHADVPPFVFWTVGEWRSTRAAILAACVATFRGTRVAVRSATCDEDRPASGLAGHYRSELDIVAEPSALARAVDRVIAAYPADGRAHHVLVQAMVRDVRRSGVVTTRDPASAGPYDVIELAEGARTDIVTSGCGVTTCVGIHHGAAPAEVGRAGFGALIQAVRAVEAARAVGTVDAAQTNAEALEIELAERTDGTVAILQVRPLAPACAAMAARDDRVGRVLACHAHTIERLGRVGAGLAGSSTVLGLMPDWNPAELIGAHPLPLAFSIFRELLADRTWQEARTSMGYQSVPRTPLVRPISGRPYVDVRASFNSFVPGGLPLRVRTALVDGWLARLRAHPELHDRVELEVAATVVHCDTAELVRGGEGLTRHERAGWLAALRALTTRAIDLGRAGSLPRALATVTQPLRPGAAASRDPATTLAATLAALARCRVAGARPFAVVARHAFMAESVLRSLVVRGAIAAERLVALRCGLQTVAGRFAADTARVAGGTMARAQLRDVYGHLRPGAFDVTSLPYALRDYAATAGTSAARPDGAEPFRLRAPERAAIAHLLTEAGLGCGVDRMLAWAMTAIVGREEAKFAFTRRLSAVLEDLAVWAAARGFTREELALLTVADLRRVAALPCPDGDWLRTRLPRARLRREREREIRLGPLIRDATDLAIVCEPPAAPTFITTRTVIAAPVQVDGQTPERADVAGKIVCIESADPGFDWLFARGIGGLVTRFGGANSHIAVRCFELGVAAALGVGERVFERVCHAPTVELRCGEGVLRDGMAVLDCGR